LRRSYVEAAQWLAAEYLLPAGITDWSDVAGLFADLARPTLVPNPGGGIDRSSRILRRPACTLVRNGATFSTTMTINTSREQAAPYSP
jgi:hypothetical protein